MSWHKETSRTSFHMCLSLSHIFGKCLSDHAFAYLVMELFCEIILWLF